jgi:hypothetical protein
MEHIQVGPVPPLVINEFSARALRELPTRDVINARDYLRWNADEPVPAANKPNPKKQGAFMDNAPISGRNQDRAQFYQAQPFVVDAPGFQDNPYFNKYDITSDPRNTIRELRGAVTESVTNKGVDESIRLFSRGFDNRFVPVSDLTVRQEKALDDWSSYKPSMNDMETNYRSQC